MTRGPTETTTAPGQSLPAFTSQVNVPEGALTRRPPAGTIARDDADTGLYAPADLEMEVMDAIGPSREKKISFETMTIAGLAVFAAASASSISVMQAGYGLAFFCWLGVVAWTRGRRGWNVSEFLEPMLAFVLASTLALLFSTDPGASLDGLKQLGLMGLILVVGNGVTKASQARLLVVTWLGAAAATSLYAALQYAQGEERARAFFDGPMTLARILTLAAPVAITLAIYSKGRIAKFAAGCSVPIVAALCLTLTRSAWLAALAAMLFLGIFKRNKRLLGCLALVVCLALLAATLRPQSTAGGLVRSIVRPFDPASARFAKSTHQRYWMWKTAVRIFPDYPLTGVGQRNFGRVYREYVPQPQADPYILRDDGTVYTGFAHAHNLYLNLLVTQGLLGLGTFLWLMFTALRLAYRTHRDRRDPFTDVLSLAILAALVAFLALGLLDENFRDSEGVLQLWFLLGLLYALPRLRPEPTPNRG